MQDIPEVLKPFVETHEEDTGEIVEVCDPECGATVVAEIGWRTIRPDYRRCVVPWRSRVPKHCESCGTIVGFSGPAEEELPYRIPFAKIVGEMHALRSMLRAVASNPLKPCPECGGAGFHVEIEAAEEWVPGIDPITGDFDASGGSFEAFPVPTQRQCGTCYGGEVAYVCDRLIDDIRAATEETQTDGT